MTCPKCGAQGSETASFCKKCGSLLPSRGAFPMLPVPGVLAGPERHAGFWLRFGANLIDSLVLGLTVGLLFWVFTFTLVWAVGLRSPGLIVLAGLLYLFMLAGSNAAVWLYFALSESSRHQATLGKRAVGALVTDLEGRRLSFGKASGRFWAKVFSGLTLYLGFIMAGFTTKKQALHDYLTGTLVIRK